MRRAAQLAEADAGCAALAEVGEILVPARLLVLRRPRAAAGGGTRLRAGAQLHG